MKISKSMIAVVITVFVLSFQAVPQVVADGTTTSTQQAATQPATPTTAPSQPATPSAAPTQTAQQTPSTAGTSSIPSLIPPPPLRPASPDLPPTTVAEKSQPTPTTAKSGALKDTTGAGADQRRDVSGLHTPDFFNRGTGIKFVIGNNEVWQVSVEGGFVGNDTDGGNRFWVITFRDLNGVILATLRLEQTERGLTGRWQLPNGVDAPRYRETPSSTLLSLTPGMLTYLIIGYRDAETGQLIYFLDINFNFDSDYEGASSGARFILPYPPRHAGATQPSLSDPGPAVVLINGVYYDADGRMTNFLISDVPRYGGKDNSFPVPDRYKIPGRFGYPDNP